MKIVLENIGSISKASIEIADLTVISGENDSGKTTISKVIYALGQATSSFRYDYQQYQEYEVSRSYNELYMYLTRYLDKNTLLSQEQSSLELGNLHRVDSRERELNEELIDQLNNLRRGTLYRSFSIFEIERIESLISRLFNSGIFPDSITDKFKGLIKEIKLKVAELHERPPTSKFIYRALKSEFSDEIVRSNSEFSKLKLFDGSHRVFDITFNNKEILDFDGDNFLRISDSTLIEGPAIFQISSLLGNIPFTSNYFSRRNKRNKFEVPYHVVDLCSKLNGTRDSLVNILEDPICDDSAWDLSEFYEGAINYEDTTELFKLSKNGYDYHGNNTSSGIKALAILDLLIKGNYITKNTVLILDEPETNLHPTWQKKYAKAIVNLVSKGAKILVSTHSPYMLEALKIYADKGDSKLLGSKFYYASKNNDEVTFVDTRGDISIIIQALSAPLYELIEESQGDIDDF